MTMAKNLCQRSLVPRPLPLRERRPRKHWEFGYHCIFVRIWAACIKKSVPCLSFGGAVHVDNNLSLSLNNNAALLKTEVIVMESNFSNNTAAYGGVITAYNSTIMVNNCGFHNSLAKSGGVIWAQTRSSVYINNCKFSANIAHSFGGGVIAAIESTTVFISDSEYIDNKDK